MTAAAASSAPSPSSGEDAAAPGSSSGIEATANILAAAAAEAADPGADTADARECPFCVMMRKGGCEAAFKAFMECGEKADKGEADMAQCLPQFEGLNKCMESNKELFDELLQEMNAEEQRVKDASTGQAGAGDEAAAAAATAAAAGPMVHHQQQQEQQQEQQQDISGSEQQQPSLVGGQPAAATM